MPYHPGTIRSHREAVLRWERLSVQLVGQEHVVAHRVGDRQAPLVVLLDVALRAVVGTAEDDLDRRRLEARLFQDRTERRARPRARPDRLVQPRLAERAWVQPRASVAGALHRHRHRDRPDAHGDRQSRA